MNLAENPPAGHAASVNLPSALPAAEAACRRMAPLWPLQNFVAVNPFVGLTDRPFIESCDLVRRVALGGMQMPLPFYQARFAAGEITETDLAAALIEGRKTLSGPWAEALAEMDVEILKKSVTGLPAETSASEFLTVAEAVDRAQGRGRHGDDRPVLFRVF